MKSVPPRKSASKSVKKSGDSPEGGKPAPAAGTRKAEPTAEAKSTTPPKKKFIPQLPPLVLEGDEPSAPCARGPGERCALGPPPAGGEGPGELAALPEAYGTQR